jgi:peptide/nickel transport system substrate-binding protein
VSRRAMLRVLAIGSVSLGLAACAPAAPAPVKPTEAPKPTAAPAKPTEAPKPAATAVPAGATPQPAAKPTEAPKPAVAAKPTGEVRIALAAEPNTFDPHLTVGRNTQIFVANVYDGLTARDQAAANLVPALASEWRLVNETTWQFKLRPGARFHNGDPFDAESVKFTLDRGIDPDTKATISSELGTIARTEVVDATTVNVVTKQPDILLPTRLGELYGGMLSRKHTEEVGKEALAIKPNGTGPFRLTEWAKNERLVLEANDAYWRGAPSVQRITVRPILEDAARIAALQAGEVDLISNVPYARVEELKRNDKLVVKTIPAPRVFFVAIDPRQPPFDNVKVRQALNYAVDVNAIIRSIYFGNAKRLATAVDTASLGYDPSVEPYPFDQARAKELLTEAGHPNGFEVEFDAFTGSIADHSKAAEAIAEYLRRVGINAKLNMFEFGAFGPRRVANQVAPLHIYSLGNAYFEPSWALKWMMQQNLGLHYRNPEIYAMLDQAEATFNPEDRKKIYGEVQRKLKDDAGFIFLFQADGVFAMSNRVDYEPRADETQWLYPISLKG